MNKTQHEIICEQQGEIAQLTKERDEAQDRTDEEWLGEIGRQWLNRTGQPWETRDGETREEGLQANITALFQVIENLTKERDEARAALRRIRCIYCDAEYSSSQAEELAGHITSCKKSPLVQMVKAMESRVIDYMDLMNDEFQRIIAITDNAEIIGICQRAMTVVSQKEPVIAQRDKAERERDEALANADKIGKQAVFEVTELEAHVETLKESRAVAVEQEQASRNECNRLRAKVAEMREALKSHHEWSAYQSKNNQIVYAGPLRSATEHAISTDCGRGYVPVSELEPTIELLRELVSSLQHFIGRNCSSSQKAETELARLQALKDTGSGNPVICPKCGHGS